MEQKTTISGVLGVWTMSVTLVPEPSVTESATRRALERFDSLDCHFYDVVSLAEAFEVAER